MFRSSRYQQIRERHEPEDEPRFGVASLILIGLVLGLVGGLVYGWLINPLVITNADPSRLNSRFQEEYIFLVSQSYAVDGDWQRAQARLALLDNPRLARDVADLFERYLREGQPPDVVRNLANLTVQLGADSPALALFGPTPLPPPVTATPTPAGPTATTQPTNTATPTQRPTLTRQPTLTPIPSAIPTLTPQPTYRLLSQERVCETGTDVYRIEVVTLDALLQDLPGIAVQVTWDEGEDRFFTGFKPARGLGYADFEMSEGVSYSVSLPDGSPQISGLRIEPCGSGREGGWRLTFQNLIFSQP